MAGGESVEGKRAERDPVDLLNRLFRSLKQGPSLYAHLIEEMEGKARRKEVSTTADAEYSETTAGWLLGGGMVYGRAGTEYSELKEQRQYMHAKLTGVPLVDLGCGYRIDGNNMRHLASSEQFKASAYIGVDRYAWDELPVDPTQNQYDPARNRDVVKWGEPPIAQVHADMLDFTARLPDDSVNFVLNGIDYYVLSFGDEYHHALARELSRATKPGGVIFGNDFASVLPDLEKLVNQGQLKLAQTALFMPSIKVFEKLSK